MKFQLISYVNLHPPKLEKIWKKLNKSYMMDDKLKKT